ncbi:TPA: hypothetical protein DHW51_12795 [Candidatus Poribacteria bacterium]|nr:hypothetical protein [Candidatus Poribacteria bacterium]
MASCYYLFGYKSKAKPINIWQRSQYEQNKASRRQVKSIHSRGLGRPNRLLVVLTEFYSTFLFVTLTNASYCQVFAGHLNNINLKLLVSDPILLAKTSFNQVA